MNWFLQVALGGWQRLISAAPWYHHHGYQYNPCTWTRWRNVLLALHTVGNVESDPCDMCACTASTTLAAEVLLCKHRGVGRTFQPQKAPGVNRQPVRAFIEPLLLSVCLHV